MQRKQGETVKVTLISTDASAGAPLVVSDANGKDRPIQPYERLVLDSMEWNIITGVTVELTDPGAVNENSLGSFNTLASGWATGGEGLNVSPGSTPLATASGAGVVEMMGTARVLNSKTQGPSAGYKALLTPGGNRNWQ